MMPEGPEVRTMAEKFQRSTVGRPLTGLHFLSGRYVRHGVPETVTKLIQGLETSSSPWMVQDCKAHGKFMFMVLQPPDELVNDVDFQPSLWMTMGMTGQFVSAKVHDQHSKHSRWYLSFGERPEAGQSASFNTMHQSLPVASDYRIYYQDIRNFGTIRASFSKKELQDKLNSLGPDLMTTSCATFLKRLEKVSPQIPLCRVLMNQSFLAGVGNYILSESLYRAQVNPFATVGELSLAQRRSIFHHAQSIAWDSFRLQGSTRPSTGTYRTYDGTPGGFTEKLMCYGQDRDPLGRPVLKAQGPHHRTVWYVQDQLSTGSEHQQQDERETNSQPSSLTKDRQPTGLSQRESSLDKESSTKAPIPPLVDALSDPTWKKALETTLKGPLMRQIQAFLDKELAQGATVYPPSQEVFAALNMCPLNRTRVVIVGQDPYHQPGQGHGLAFSVRPGVPLPPSLKNILREVYADGTSKQETTRARSSISQGNLEQWAQQGVLLLNTVLTVRHNEANSHKGQGWEEFTDEVIRVLAEGEQPIVFLLWGKPAALKARHVDTKKHVVIQTSHPSPLGAHRTKSPFIGSRCFSRVNEALKSMNLAPINWNL